MDLEKYSERVRGFIQAAQTMALSRNHQQFLPEHLRYMHSYFRQRPSNGLFPVSVIAVTALAATAWHSAVAMSFSAFEVTACSFVAMLLSLALLEHWFMVLPLPSEKLWDWGLRSRAPHG